MVFGKLSPQETVDESQLQSGLRNLLIDGVCSQVMGVLTGGAFLVAFAILLGASNTVIGLFAAIGPFTQILQIPSIFLVDRFRRRKLLVVVSSLFSRFFWLLVAALPWIVPTGLQVPLLVAALAVYFGLGAISGCAFNSWMRDLIPEQTMGSYFARRMAISVALGAVLSLAAGFGVDAAETYLGWQELSYTILFTVGGLAGLAGSVFLSRIPEPRMPESVSDKGLLSTLAEPFRDKNFRSLLWFLAIWNFAINLAGPFFVVYMLKRLGLSMAWVLSLAVLSQLVNVLFLRLWGRLADRYTNKSVLAASGPMFLLSVLLWVFTTTPDRHVLTIPLLIAIHALAGMSTAGVGLCAGNIALRAAPRGKATSYLATNALVSGMAATAGPILGGIAGDMLADSELRVELQWVVQREAGAVARSLPAISAKGLDFLFLGAVAVGIYAMHRLGSVKEEGEVEEKVVLTRFYGEVRKAVRHVSNVAGVRTLTYFPYAVLSRLNPFGRGEDSEPPTTDDLMKR